MVFDLPVGEAAGLGLVSGFFSSFLSPLAGLEAGNPVDVGDAVAAGLEATTGEVAAGDGVVLAGLLVLGSQAPKNAAMAAKTVSRNDLLIVFSSLFLRIAGLAVFPEGRDPLGPLRLISTQPDAKSGLPAHLDQKADDHKCGNCNTASQRTDVAEKLARILKTFLRK